MSLDARLKQGLPMIVAPIDVDQDLAFVRVTAVAQQRERRNVIIAALAGAAAALAILIAGGRVADAVLGLEVPLPPAREEEPNRQDDRRIDDDIIDRDEGERRINDDERPRREETIDDGIVIVAPRDTNGESSTDSGGSVMDRSPRRQQEPSGDTEQAPKPAEPARQNAEPRSQTKSYSLAGAPVGGGTTSCDRQTEGAGCVRFDAEPGESSVSLSISDNSGATVAAWVQIDRDGDGTIDGDWTRLCNETRAPIAIPDDGRAVIWVELDSGTCADGRDSNPVSGSVTAVFSV